MEHPWVDGKKVLPVTVIINIWKREYLRGQLDALLQQTCLPEEIWIIHYEDHIDVDALQEEYKVIFPHLFRIRSDMNLKYFGRFSIAAHVKSEYVWLLDDDVIPGRKWMQLSHEKCSGMNVIIGATGRIIPPDDFLPEMGTHGNIREYFIGDCYDSGNANYCPCDKVVDFACNSYFLKSEWIRYFWSVWPFTFDSGEDIHLSASLKLRKNITTVVPAQLCEETSGNLQKEFSRDEHASYLKPGFFKTREGVLRNMIQVLGWKPILWS